MVTVDLREMQKAEMQKRFDPETGLTLIGPGKHQ
jgi:hypothetical protein